jgi:hypothetical protein
VFCVSYQRDAVFDCSSRWQWLDVMLRSLRVAWSRGTLSHRKTYGKGLAGKCEWANERPTSHLLREEPHHQSGTHSQPIPNFSHLIFQVSHGQTHTYGTTYTYNYNNNHISDTPQTRYREHELPPSHDECSSQSSRTAKLQYEDVRGVIIITIII